jgi:hypothetical protein
MASPKARIKQLEARVAELECVFDAHAEQIAALIMKDSKAAAPPKAGRGAVSRETSPADVPAAE